MTDLNLVERATAVGFALGWHAGRVFDTQPARVLFDLVSDIGWRRGGTGTARLRANLRRVVGPDRSDSDLDALTRRGLRSYARYFREVFWMPTARPGVVAGRTRMYGAENVEAARREGRGVICALPHTGNWDAAAVAYLARFGPPMTVVAERLRPESLYRRFQSYRESLGMNVVPLTGGGRPSASVLAASLRAGGTVCLVCDRDLSSSGVPVSFFGQVITVPPGPALLAFQTGAALIPTLPGFYGDDWSLKLLPEVHVGGPGAPKRLRNKVTQAMQKVVDQFAAEIAETPEDWHMVQRLWREDLEPAATESLPR
ncbi:MAG: phosphatidylinositol mannoside acyltransferase [Geodermatophilaceae bacterium]|nr:phosphatidylinositol mannoside acyltransferase [Geodermatophilaceae bacterium]